MRRKLKKSKRKSPSMKIKKKRRVTMPRRRKVRRVVRYLRPKRRRSKSGMSMRNLLIGGAVVSFLEPTIDTFLDQMIPIQIAGTDPKDLGKVLIGYYLAKKKGITKGMGYSLLLIGFRNIVKGLTSGFKLGIGTSTTENW